MPRWNRSSPEDDIRLLVSSNPVVSFSKLTCPRRQITIIHGKNLIPMKTERLGTLKGYQKCYYEVLKFHKLVPLWEEMTNSTK